ncbi:MAG: tRNA pseudouridine(38-40) synthase TruA [Eubacterium sp.]|nr:tRNA pseudouridine(38-40) synthase TruA [Eubacterium sp.]
MEKRRIRLTIAYDGTAYCGWQIQPNGITVQQVLNDALQNVLKKPVRTIGASRTDAGVHASGNVVIFDTESRIPADKFAFALNTWLPADVKVQASEEVAPDWHPHFVDSIKTYEYRILNRQMPDPMQRLDSLFCYYHLDLAAMQKAAQFFVGTHDFASFAAGGGATEQASQSSYESPEKYGTVRTIYRADVLCENFSGMASATGILTGEASANTSSAGAFSSDPVSANLTSSGPASSSAPAPYHDMIRFVVSGNGFLYNMVRIMAGTLLEIGKCALAPDSIPDILAARSREAAGPTAPAHGLRLVQIKYP